MARDIDLETNYWVDVPPNEFEYGRSYQLLRKPYDNLEAYTPVMEISDTGYAAMIEENSIAKSNYRVIANDTTLQDKVAYGRSGHGYDSVIIPADRQPAKEVVDIISALADYPVLDEMDLGELEAEARFEDWESWGRSEFIKKTLVPAIVAYSEAYEESIESDDAQDKLEDNNEVVDHIWNTLGGWDATEYGSSGTNFAFNRIQRKLAAMDDAEVLAALEPALDLIGLAFPSHMKLPKF